LTRRTIIAMSDAKAREKALGALAKEVAAHPEVKGRCTDVFVQALEAEGIDYVFGIPGEENLDFLDSLRQAKSLKLIVTRHEQAAGFMAAIVGRLTGHPAACLSTLGPGATNFATSAAYAHLGGFPCVILTGQKPIRHSKQGHFQIVDIVEHLKPVTKFTKQIAEASTVPYLVRDCVRISKEEKPGPVHLELPEDIAAHDVGEGVHLFPPHPIRRPIADEKAIDKALTLLKAAKRPLVCIAAGCNRKTVQNMMTQFVDKLGLFAVATQMGKGALAENHSNYIGCTALSANDIVHVAIEQADLILNIGHDVVEKPPFFMKPNGTPVVIHMSFSSAETDAVYYPHAEVIGDIGNALWQIKEKLEPQKHWDSSFFAHCREVVQKNVFEGKHTASSNFPMNIQSVVRTLRAALEPSAILCLDNGMYKIHVARDFPALQPNTVLLDNALATMGAGLPAAIAAKLIEPTKQVVALCGDGGFMMNSQELETALRLGLHLTCIVLNDSGYGMIKWKQGTSGFPCWGLDYHNPDFVKYAESYGAKGHRLEKAADLPALLKKCLTEPAVHLLEIPISYVSSDLELNVELKKVVADLRAEATSWAGKSGSPPAKRARK